MSTEQPPQHIPGPATRTLQLETGGRPLPVAVPEPLSLSDLLISAARYYAGRPSGLADKFASQLAQAWPQLAFAAASQIRRDLQELFARDDEVRQWRKDRAADLSPEFATLPLPLGSDDCRAAWELVRNAWEQYGP